AGFIEAVTGYAGKYNAERFPVPLPFAEVKATGKSIGKWTYRKMSPQGFRAWGDARRAKSVIARQSRAEERAQAIMAFKAEHPDMSNRMIAKVFGVAEGTVRNVLNAYDCVICNIR
ncbi:MAG: helix-turn-helix domain-containing protein, partial [Treponema sp.]|nr:helix-turn-helix domain-containing protein [Treponema sp.]